MSKPMDGRSSSNVLLFLEGLRFPCSKTDMVDYAENRVAPDEIVDLLFVLPDRVYRSTRDVVSAVSRIGTDSIGPAGYV